MKLSLSCSCSSSFSIRAKSFDAWGNYRDPATWAPIPSGGGGGGLWLYRGFTGHEHLPQFALINMNGRMYDPLLGRMLSPDNEVQAPGFTQSYNRYSYVFNNPLKYTDPSGWGGTVGDIDDWWNSQIDASYNSFNGPSGGGSWFGGIYGGGGGYGSGGSWSSPSGSWSGTAGGPQGFWTTVSEVSYYGSTNPRDFSPQTNYYSNSYDYFTSTGYTTPGLGPDNDNYSGVYGYTGVGLAASGGSGGSGSGGVLGEAYAQQGGGPGKSGTNTAGSIDLTNEFMYPGVSISLDPGRSKGYFNPITSTIHLPGWLQTKTPADVRDYTRHEYGHYLQLQKYGLHNFLTIVSPISIYSALTNSPRKHMSTWTEKEASKLSNDYFQSRFPEPYGAFFESSKFPIK